MADELFYRDVANAQRERAEKAEASLTAAQQRIRELEQAHKAALHGQFLAKETLAERERAAFEAGYQAWTTRRVNASTGWGEHTWHFEDDSVAEDEMSEAFDAYRASRPEGT